MPEAVIVATARSPIGRAFKGSLVSIRPDDLTCQLISAALAKVPQLEPGRHRRPDAGLRAARWRAGLQHGPGGRRHARLRQPPRHHDHPVLLVVAADHPDGLPRHQGGRGRRVHLGRRGVRQPVRPRAAATAGRTRTTRCSPTRRQRSGAARRGRARRSGTTRARTAPSRTSTSRWARPRRTWPSCAGSPGPSRTSSASGRRTWPRRRWPTGSGSARSPRSRCPTAPW